MRETITWTSKGLTMIGLLVAAMAATSPACQGIDEEPTCGDGVCEAGESMSCSDCSDPDPDPPPNDDGASLLVRNQSSYSIWYLYVTECSSGTWGPDQLGSRTIPSGSSFTVTHIPEGCWDFRATNQDAVHYWERYGTILSEGEVFTWTLIN